MMTLPHIYPRGAQEEPWASLDAEAAHFAVGFLMPEEEFRTRHALGWSDAELGEYFDVHQRHVQVRRECLGLAPGKFTDENAVVSC